MPITIFSLAYTKIHAYRLQVWLIFCSYQIRTRIHLLIKPIKNILGRYGATTGLSFPEIRNGKSEIKYSTQIVSEVPAKITDKPVVLVRRS